MANKNVLQFVFATHGHAIGSMANTPVAIHIDAIEAASPAADGTSIRTMSGAIYNVTASYSDVLAAMTGDTEQ